MTSVFADSHYYFALLSRSDADHARAVEFSRTVQKLTTTEWVLTELGDGLAHPSRRPQFLALLDVLKSSPEVEIVPSTPDLFARGVELYARRPDKEWSLTDCISFAVMEDHGIRAALTADRHFEQAGFQALLT